MLGIDPVDFLEHILSFFRPRDWEENMPGYLATHEAFMNDVKLRKLSELLPTGRDLVQSLRQSGSFDRHILGKVAALVQNLAEQNLHCLWLDPQVLLTDGEKLLISPLVIPFMLFSDEGRIDESVRQKYYYRFPYRTTILNYKQVTSNLGRSAFVHFLLELLFPEVPFQKFNRLQAPSLIHHFSSNCTPEFQNLVREYMVQSATGELQDTPEMILEKMLHALNHSILNPAKYLGVDHELFFDVRRGREKTGSHTQDEYEFIMTDTTPRRFLFMIADGVSTSSLGDGETMARLLRDVVVKERRSILEALQDLPVDDWEQFHEKAHALLLPLVQSMNQDAVGVLNQKLLDNQLRAGEVEHPMSATLILGCKVGSWCHFVHLGDSEVILVRGQTAYLLNQPHNQFRDRILHEASTESTVQEQVDGDSELSRVIPVFEIHDDQFVGVGDLGDLVDQGSVCTRQGDILIFTTDGLLTCLSQGSMFREAGLDALVSILKTKEKESFWKRMQEVVRRADDVSMDDVAVVALLDKGPLKTSVETPNAPPEKPRLNETLQVSKPVRNGDKKGRIL